MVQRNQWSRMLGGLTLGLALLAGAAPLQAAEERPVVEVLAYKMAFNPKEITIPVGTTVVWSNQDKGATYHTVTSDQAGLFDTGPFFPGEQARLTFDKPGEFPYHCIPHREVGMVGKVTVTP